MKILITGVNAEWEARRIKEIAEAENIKVETKVCEGNPERFMQPTDMVVYDLIVFLYKNAADPVPEMIERFKCRLIFPNTGIEPAVTRQTLRSLNRGIRARRC